MPASRADIFAVDGLALPQRRALSRFLSAAQAAMAGGGPLQACLAIMHTIVHRSSFRM